jgi:hypothetical protein
LRILIQTAPYRVVKSHTIRNQLRKVKPLNSSFIYSSFLGFTSTANKSNSRRKEEEEEEYDSFSD